MAGKFKKGLSKTISVTIDLALNISNKSFLFYFRYCYSVHFSLPTQFQCCPEPVVDPVRIRSCHQHRLTNKTCTTV